MTKEKSTFKTIPDCTSVTWHYRSAIGHGRILKKPFTIAELLQIVDNTISEKK